MAIEIYNDVITEEQATEIVDLCGEKPVMMFDKDKRKQVLRHFSDFFDSLNISPHRITLRYFQVPKPYSVHSDGFSANNNTYPVNYTFLVPLMWNPITACSHTVFFDQLCDVPNHGGLYYTHFDVKRTASGRAIPTSSKFDELINITDESFDQKTYEEQLSHIDYNDLHGLSVYESIKWSIGDVIKSESNRLHCSAAFGTDKISSKAHLLFQTYIPE